MDSQIISQPATPLKPPPPSRFLNVDELLLLSVFGLLGLLSLLEGQNRGRKTRFGRWAKAGEKRKARTQAIRQQQQRRHNRVALSIGLPSEGVGLGRYAVPDAERGIAVVGNPGAGKTFSVIDPLVRSALSQGFPVILYDFKYPQQTSRHAALARQLGYDVTIFAPGFEESCVCNPLDFLASPLDAETARQLADVFVENARRFGGRDSSDPFFDQAGKQLVEGLLMLTKTTNTPDLMMTHALLSQPNLASRLEQKDDLNPWIKARFGQIIGVKESEKTAASIIASAASVFGHFIKPKVIRSLVGTTTLPLTLTGRQLVIFGMDRERRDVLGPVMAAILHLLVQRNTAQKRSDPLVLSLDEVPTLYLPRLMNWVNESREDGLVTILGYQNQVQLQHLYGDKLARGLFSACATKFLFNPGEVESARYYSDMLGEEEITRWRSTFSHSKQGRQRTRTQEDRTRKLFEPSQFLTLPQGTAIVLSPGVRGNKQAGLPQQIRFRIPKTDQRLSEVSVSLFPHIQTLCRQHNVDVTAEDLEARLQTAAALLKSEADEKQSPDDHWDVE